MPMYRISVVNEEFRATAEHELSCAANAREEGVRAALAMGADEVCNGKAFFGAAVIIEEDGHSDRRFVVSVGASPLSSSRLDAR
jgi:hypothetical protein